tara:strand:+ start:434 stop:607 length:174 start_codon:yes stop_codon:yes gene_type:complete
VVLDLSSRDSVTYLKKSMNMLHVLFGLVKNKMTEGMALPTVMITQPGKFGATGPNAR